MFIITVYSISVPFQALPVLSPLRQLNQPLNVGGLTSPGFISGLQLKRAVGSSQVLSLDPSNNRQLIENEMLPLSPQLQEEVLRYIRELIR